MKANVEYEEYRRSNGDGAGGLRLGALERFEWLLIHHPRLFDLAAAVVRVATKYCLTGEPIVQSPLYYMQQRSRLGRGCIIR